MVSYLNKKIKPMDYPDQTCFTKISILITIRLTFSLRLVVEFNCALLMPIIESDADVGLLSSSKVRFHAMFLTKPVLTKFDELIVISLISTIIRLKSDYKRHHHHQESVRKRGLIKQVRQKI